MDSEGSSVGRSFRRLGSNSLMWKSRLTATVRRFPAANMFRKTCAARETLIWLAPVEISGAPRPQSLPVNTKGLPCQSRRVCGIHGRGDGSEPGKGTARLSQSYGRIKPALAVPDEANEVFQAVDKEAKEDYASRTLRQSWVRSPCRRRRSRRERRLSGGSQASPLAAPVRVGF